jgi:arylsulfatase
VVLITIDTLRADHLGCYGYAEAYTPLLDRLAREGFQFAETVSTSSWTAPAMASLFTAQFPRTHQVMQGFYVPGPGQLVYQDRLSARLTTLAERLRSIGYRTVGISSNPHLVKEAGFAQGFDVFIEHHPRREAFLAGRQVGDRDLEQLRTVSLDAQQVTGRALEALAEVPADAPFFLWVHYMDPHWPYLPQQPWFQALHGGEQATIPPEVVTKAGEELMRTGDVSPELKRLFIAAYDSEIAFADRALVELLRAVPREALLVITADHGEQFLEHGRTAHGSSLHYEEVRVPLLVRLPLPEDQRRERSLIADPASLIDIPVTIWSFLGQPADPEDRGDDLLPFMARAARGAGGTRALISELERPDYMVALTSGAEKLMVYSQEGGGERVELYDIAADPEEHRDLPRLEAGGARRRSAELRALLELWRASTPEGRPEKITPPADDEERRRLEQETVENMRALGYVR